MVGQSAGNRGPHNRQDRHIFPDPYNPTPINLKISEIIQILPSTDLEIWSLIPEGEGGESALAWCRPLAAVRGTDFVRPHFGTVHERKSSPS
jgi:hypothetical protein